MGKINLPQAIKVVVKKGTNAAKHGITKYNNWKIPSSINWLFGFGFKIGLLLALKSFLILRYQGSNLTLQGLIIVGSQLVLGTTFIACGMLMQDTELYNNPFSIRNISRFYAFTGIFCSIIMAFRVLGKWQFFKNPASVNWFIDFFSGAFKGMKEIGLSILFIDCDLWVAFCVLLFIISAAYLNVKFMYQDSPIGRLMQRIPALNSGRLSITEESECRQDDEE